MQSTGLSPARRTPFSLAWTMASLSQKSRRRSEWPTSTNSAPASRAISGETSPVMAPLGSEWQVWAPSFGSVGLRSAASRASALIGGKTTVTSVSGLNP